MKPAINIDFKSKAAELIEVIGKRKASYLCGVETYTLERIAKGETTRVEFDCGTLINWHHDKECLND